MDMSMNLRLFEDCAVSKGRYCYAENFLKTLNDNQIFSCKARSEIDEVISFINVKLSSADDRPLGLNLLKIFLHQCSDTVFTDNAISWMQQCIRTLNSCKEKKLTVLTYDVLGSLLYYSAMTQELTKNISSSILPRYFEHLKHLDQVPISALNCTEIILRHYGGPCGPHKGILEQFLMQYVDCPIEQTVHAVARCVALLPLVGGGGTLNVNYKACWKHLEEKLVKHLHEILDNIFEGVSQDQMFQDTGRNAEGILPVPAIEETNAALKIHQLTIRFINLTRILRALLLSDFPVTKTVVPSFIVNILIRGLAVNNNKLLKNKTVDKLVVWSLVPQIHIALLKLLQALIMCCGTNLLEYGCLFCKLVTQTLKWTSCTNSQQEGVQRPYVQLRKEACDTLTLWLQVAKSGSCLEISSPEELISMLLDDVKAVKSSVMLLATRSTIRHPTKRQRKWQKSEQISTSQLGNLSSRLKFQNIAANHESCTAALRALQWILQSVGMFLKPVLHKVVQEAAVKLLLNVQRGDIPVPYGEGPCRLELYRLLHVLVVVPHDTWPPPIHFALHIMSVGQMDANIEVTRFCSQALNEITKLVHPTCSSLNFPVSVEEMQKLSNEENHTCEREQIEAEKMDVEEGQLRESDALEIPSIPLALGKEIDENVDSSIVLSSDHENSSSESVDSAIIANPNVKDTLNMVDLTQISPQSDLSDGDDSVTEIKTAGHTSENAQEELFEPNGKHVGVLSNSHIASIGDDQSKDDTEITVSKNSNSAPLNIPDSQVSYSSLEEQDVAPSFPDSELELEDKESGTDMDSNLQENLEEKQSLSSYNKIQLSDKQFNLPNKYRIGYGFNQSSDSEDSNVGVEDECHLVSESCEDRQEKYLGTVEVTHSVTVDLRKNEITSKENDISAVDAHCKTISDENLAKKATSCLTPTCVTGEEGKKAKASEIQRNGGCDVKSDNDECNVHPDLNVNKSLESKKLVHDGCSSVLGENGGNNLERNGCGLEDNSKKCKINTTGDENIRNAVEHIPDPCKKPVSFDNIQPFDEESVTIDCEIEKLKQYNIHVKRHISDDASSKTTSSAEIIPQIQLCTVAESVLSNKSGNAIETTGKSIETSATSIEVGGTTERKADDEKSETRNGEFRVTPDIKLESFTSADQETEKKQKVTDSKQEFDVMLKTKITSLPSADTKSEIKQTEKITPFTSADITDNEEKLTPDTKVPLVSSSDVYTVITKSGGNMFDLVEKEAASNLEDADEDTEEPSVKKRKTE